MSQPPPPPPPPNEPPQQPQPSGFGPPPHVPDGGYGYPQPPAQPPSPPGPYQQGPYQPGPSPYGPYAPQPPWPGYPAQGGAPGQGGGDGGNRRILAIVGSVLGVAALVAGLGYVLLSGSSDSPGSGGSSGSATGGPRSTTAANTVSLPVPSGLGTMPVTVDGGWSTGRIFAKSTVDGVIGADARTGATRWHTALPGEVCAAAKWQTSDHRAALVTKAAPGEDASCSRLVVLDLTTGRKVMEKTLPGTEGSYGEAEATLSGHTVAVSWLEGSAGYDLRTGRLLWHGKPGGSCRDTGYAGGPALMAVVQCGDDYRHPDFQVQRLDPDTGRTVWKFAVPRGVQTVRVASTKPLTLVVGAGTSTPTDVMTVGDDAKLKAKISLGERFATGCDSDVESCNGMAVGKDAVYLPSKEHAEGGADDYYRTNEVVKFSATTGNPVWQSPADHGRIMLPIRMSGSSVVAYELPKYQQGGEVVSIEPRAGHRHTLLKLPAATEDAESSFVIGTASVDQPIVYDHGRLFLQQHLVSSRSAGIRQYLAMGFGPR